MGTGNVLSDYFFMSTFVEFKLFLSLPDMEVQIVLLTDSLFASHMANSVKRHDNAGQSTYSGERERWAWWGDEWEVFSEPNFLLSWANAMEQLTGGFLESLSLFWKFQSAMELHVMSVNTQA